MVRVSPNLSINIIAFRSAFCTLKLLQQAPAHTRASYQGCASTEASSTEAPVRDMPPTPTSMEMGGVSTVKIGADGKESALLVRRGAGRWIGLVAVVLVLGVGGAWYTHERRMKGKAEMSRLTRLLHDTGSRVETLRKVSDRLDDSTESSETKEKIAKEMKIGSEVHKAQVEHARAQANVMKRGNVPNVLHAAAADKAAQTVPADMQRAMLGQFLAKGQFLMWATTKEREQAWRKSPSFGKAPGFEVESELDSLEEMLGDGAIDTRTVVSWLRGNITAGNYPPPVNVLSGIGGYLEALTDAWEEENGLFVEYEKQKKADSAKADGARRATVQRLVALAADEAAWQKDPTPVFKSLYAALVQYDLTEWLYPADDPDLDEGEGSKFAAHKKIIKKMVEAEDDSYDDSYDEGEDEDDEDEDEDEEDVSA